MIAGLSLWHLAAIIVVGTVIAVVIYYAATTDRFEWQARLEAFVEQANRTGGQGKTAATSSSAKTIYATVAATAVSVGVFWALWRYTGPLNAIIYTLTFVAFLAAFPTAVALLGNEMPASTKVSKLHIILGALSFGRTVLVDFGDRYELCPAEYDRVYIDGQWYDIDSGLDNWSMFGWRPFAITRFKDDDTYLDVRADTAAEKRRGDGYSVDYVDDATAADGGTVKRGGLREASPPAVSGMDGTWLIDLKRVFTRGIRRIGDIDLIETAEEVAQREQAHDGLIGRHNTMITFVVTLLLGIVTGYAFFAA